MKIFLCIWMIFVENKIKVISNLLQSLSTSYPTQYSVPKMYFKVYSIKENLTMMFWCYFLPHNKRTRILVVILRQMVQTDKSLESFAIRFCHGKP